MRKIVNIEPTLPITTVVPAIFNPVYNCDMSVGDILNCICAKAKVTEVLKDGSLVRLNLTNYNKVNETKTVEKVETVLAKIEEIVTPLSIDRELEETSEIQPEEIDYSGLTEEKIEECKEVFIGEPEIVIPEGNELTQVNHKKNKKNKR